MKFSIFRVPQFKSNLHNQMQQAHLQVDMGLIRYTLQVLELVVNLKMWSPEDRLLPLVFIFLTPDSSKDHKSLL